jgi:invasion protein IalB
MKCRIPRCFAAIVLAGLAATSVGAEETNLSGLIYSPWTKFCLKETCFVGSGGRWLPDCEPIVSAVLIERFRNSSRSLQVNLPARVNTEHAVRIVIDQGEAIERSFVGCRANGCRAEYEGGAELVEQFRDGRYLRLEAVDKANLPITVTIPLTGFDEAYDGAPQEPKVFEMTAKKLQAEIEERKSRCGTGQNQ